MGKRKLIHICAIIFVFTITLNIVNAINKSYWDSPVGAVSLAPARERIQEFPWLEGAIGRLVRTYSVPIGLITFLSFYGAFASIFELHGMMKYIVALSFLYPAAGTISPLIVLMMLIIPMFIGIGVSLVLTWITWQRTDQKAIYFSVMACIHNVVFACVIWKYLGSLFSVFGD